MFADMFTDSVGGQTVLRAMPLLLMVLCILAIAYRYYSAFLAAKVAALDDARLTPAHQFSDGQNYHPTNKWVLFGHHFAAISGAGPLIGPVLAIQYGYMPGLLWLVIGVCLAGAVQDMLVLAASVRRGGKSLAQIALTELGRPASIVVSLAILVIVIIALAGLGAVVVKALGGEEVKLPPAMQITLPQGQESPLLKKDGDHLICEFPENCKIRYDKGGPITIRPEGFLLQLKGSDLPAGTLEATANGIVFHVPAESLQIVPGSSWGTFTIACTIPIAFLVSLWMYRIRPGRVVEASMIGAVGVIAATILGALIPGSFLEPYFALGKNQTILALCIYGFIASVLPVWLLLCPRDYISSFLKIGTIFLLVVGVIAANPAMKSPALNHVFASGGPTFAGNIFPFVFICIMCGAVSGFHSLVSSGTTPKMVDKESHIRPIGYGSMLIEGLVGVIALIAAASMPVDLYYDINVPLEKASDSKLQGQLAELYKDLGIDKKAAEDPLLTVGSGNLAHLNVDNANLSQIQELVGGESLRGRTGGAVTLAVGMATIFTQAMHNLNLHFEGVMKYWYHFAIMFEALFILTTIDTGTRIARFLLQETVGKAFPRFEQTDWLPGATLATALVTAGWGLLVATGSIATIWPMFGIANQLLAVLALCLVTTLLVNSGRGRYAWVTLAPMLFVTSTTMTAGVLMSQRFMLDLQGRNVLGGILNLVLTLVVMVSVGLIVLLALSRWLAVWMGKIETKPEAD
ncbi:MAG: carbon starvation protein A [Gemmataceae bacterium]|nr:carbon starvation protein A [Gemmataceae bacterium]MCI0740741.1 carbon starvation protein A [Gemmataceae bacterium]